jgi:glutaredoxin
MKEINIVVYTMKDCPFCTEFKDMLTKEGIEFFDRDIDEHEEEYNLFSEITKNDMVPALLIVEGDEKEHDSYLYAPERDYNELTEAVSIIKNHIGGEVI